MPLLSREYPNSHTKLGSYLFFRPFYVSTYLGHLMLCLCLLLLLLCICLFVCLSATCFTMALTCLVGVQSTLGSQLCSRYPQFLWPAKFRANLPLYLCLPLFLSLSVCLVVCEYLIRLIFFPLTTYHFFPFFCFQLYILSPLQLCSHSFSSFSLSLFLSLLISSS